MISREEAENQLRTETRTSVTRNGRVVVQLDSFVRGFLLEQGYLKVYGPGLAELTERGKAWCGTVDVTNT